MASGDNYLGLLNNVSTVVTKSQTLDEAIQPVLKLICEATGWSIGHALTVSSDDILQSTAWHAADGYPRQHFEQFRQASEATRASGKKILADRVLADGLPKWVTGDPKGKNHFPKQSPAAQALLPAGFAFPLHLENKVVGVLVFYALRPQNPDSELVKVMAKIGTTLGHVVQRQTVQDESLGNAKRAWQIIDNAGEAFIAMDDSGRITSWNKSATHIFGWPQDEAIGRRVSDTIIPRRLRDAHEHGVQRFLKSGDSSVLGKAVEVTAVHRHGREFTVEMTRWALQGPAGLSFYAFLRDATERKQHEQELKQEGYRARELEQQPDYDDLTGLPNKGMLMDGLVQALSSVDHATQHVSIFVVDLDNFKRINNYMGKSVGDNALVATARKLQSQIRSGDTLARLYGDTFTLTCTSIHTHNNAEMFARRLLDLLTEPLRIEPYNLRMTASIGIALSAGDDNEESLLSAAHSAMRTAKNAGGGHYEILERQTRADDATGTSLLSDLEQALKQDQLILHFQPIVSADSRQIVAVEAMLRWNHPVQGLLHPGEFMPTAEEGGLLPQVTECIIKEAYRCSRFFLNEKHLHEYPLDILLNLSAKNLEDPGLVKAFDRVQKLSAKNSVNFQFGVEITEAKMMHNPEAANRTLEQLQALGVKLYLDDFGTRYSTLSHLKRLSVNGLKIDKSFVQDMDQDSGDYKITHAIIQLAHALDDITVIAQGVDSQNQADTLHDAGADLLQGSLFAQPLPLDELVETSFFKSF